LDTPLFPLRTVNTHTPFHVFLLTQLGCFLSLSLEVLNPWEGIPVY